MKQVSSVLMGLALCASVLPAAHARTLKGESLATPFLKMVQKAVAINLTFYVFLRGIRMSINKKFFASSSLISFLSVAILLIPAETHAADAKDGAAQVKQNSCVACHGMDKKIVGPGFAEIAAKYKGDANATTMLTQKIKTGTSGTWGAVPMPAQAHIKDEDIKTMVSWILAGAK